MQILVAFFFAAIVGCYGNECARKGRSCTNRIIEIQLDADSTKELFCDELVRTIECMTEVTESCAGKPVEEDLKAALLYFKDRKEEECKIVDTPRTPVITSKPHSTQETKYTISWRVSSDNLVDEYSVMYRKRAENEEWEIKAVPALDDTDEEGMYTQMYQISKLQPGTEYEAVVKARNKFGWSDHSEVLIFTTKSEDLQTDDSEIQKCFEENADYISECLQEGENKVMEMLADRSEDKVFEDMRVCGLYIETVFCTVGRVDEKCGEEAVVAFVKEIGDTPEDVENACRAIGVEIVSGLDEDKRKK